MTSRIYKAENQPFIAKRICLYLSYLEKQKEIWLSPMTKAPTPTENSKKQLDNAKTPP